jgi:hypothetical protein
MTTDTKRSHDPLGQVSKKHFWDKWQTILIYFSLQYFTYRYLVLEILSLFVVFFLHRNWLVFQVLQLYILVTSSDHIQIYRQIFSHVPVNKISFFIKIVELTKWIFCALHCYLLNKSVLVTRYGFNVSDRRVTVAL